MGSSNDQMKVLLVSTFKNYGGAATSTTRLVNAFNKHNIQVEQLYIFEEKKSFGSGLIQSGIGKISFWIHFIFERFLILISIKNRRDLYQFSTGNGSVSIISHPSVVRADVVHLHWVNFSFLSIEQIAKLAKSKPLTWTMHDMWPFTGGCHYAYDCENYLTDCSNCFYLSKLSAISSRRILAQKDKGWANVDFTLIGVSEWISSLASKSILFKNKRVEIINNPLDVEIFKPNPDKVGETSFSILFGAVEIEDKRKGFSYLIQAMKLLEKEIDNLELTIFGAISNEFFDDLDCAVNLLGRIGSEEKMVKAYNNADVFILPSVQETLSYTTMEAMACGTPVVVFNCGGVTDLVIHKKTGYLAENKNVNDLVEGVRYFLDSGVSKTISNSARQHVVDNFSENVIVEKHIWLYNEIIEKHELTQEDG